MPSPDNLNGLRLTCDNDTFLEVLLNSIRNEILNLQSWTKKVKNVKKATLSRQLTELKGDFNINHAEVSNVENELNRLIDEELGERIKAMKLFEGLNSEKPNTMFLSLAKKANISKLSVIRDNNGRTFDSDELRNEFITSFYESLYKKPADEPASHENVIEDFLGPDILGSDIVMNSKLTAQEAESLDSPLTIDEFDKAVLEGNPKSAPGSDGLGMPLIRICWNYLRYPLFNYTIEAHRKGIMTPSFRGASVRLIPKKGDFSNIKNWRPISLLSNVYKIFSRVLNNRIAKYTNRICSRAQKGFNTCRYTQEAVINVWESIAHCRKNNIHAAILAADMEKAFDSISLGYLDQVYKFFGIGPYMRSLLKLAGNEREACIILDNRILSRNFKLERGRPQGDIISPLTFNFCIQILIFKLELDPRIERIPRPVFADQILDPNDRIQSFFRYESARETDNIEALADDNTAITLLNASSLGTVKQILDDFSRISGLKCNTSKTVVMPTFDYTENDRKIVTDLGFAIADKITLLGVEISNKLDNISDIFTKIREKIVKLINFWDRFKLSLPGRITILKTCLISQLNYIGCFLPVPHDVLDSIQMLLDNFVKKNLRVAKERLYLSAEKGGLGCIDLKTFLAGQTCAWFVRCFKFKIDNWRHDLVMAAPEKNLTLLRSLDLDPVSSPILHNIASSFEKFYSDFTRINGNFKAA